MRLHRIQAVLLKLWYVSISDKTRFFDMFYWAVMGVIMFGFTASFIAKTSTIPDIAIYLIGGMILWMLFLRTQLDIDIFVFEDFWSQTVKNVFTTPLKASELFVALAVFAFGRAAVTTVLTFAVAYFAYSFNLFGGHIAAFVFILPLFIFAWAVALFALSVVFRFGSHNQVVAWSIPYLFQPLSAMYFPASTLPAWLLVIAKAFPLLYTFEGYRLAYAGTFSWMHFGIAVLLSTVYFALTFWLFVSSVEKSRRTGKLAQY